MAFDQIVTLNVAPADADAFETAFAALAAKVGQGEPDTLDYRLFKVDGEAGAYRVVESYASEEALDLHRKNPDIGAEMAAVGKLLAGRPTVDVLKFCTSAR